MHEFPGFGRLCQALQRCQDGVRVRRRAREYLAELAMPLADYLSEIAPLYQVLLPDDLLGRPTKLKTREKGDRSTTLRPVLLHEQLLVLEPLLNVGQDTEQETACLLLGIGTNAI